jgi:hypothetical protein
MSGGLVTTTITLPSRALAPVSRRCCVSHQLNTHAGYRLSMGAGGQAVLQRLVPRSSRGRPRITRRRGPCMSTGSGCCALVSACQKVQGGKRARRKQRDEL